MMIFWLTVAYLLGFGSGVVVGAWIMEETRDREIALKGGHYEGDGYD